MAIITEVSVTAERFSTAVDNIVDGAFVAGQHALAILLQVFWAVNAENVSELESLILVNRSFMML
jgi:hypothetical protein